MNDNNFYNEDSIQSLAPLEHVRLRPGMYIGDTSTPNQLLLEIFSNSLDEYNIGHGDMIKVIIPVDGYDITVIDSGQGFPIDVKREDGKTVLEAAFSVINSSGKFSDDGVYGGNSLGLNGLGGKITNFLSSKFEVRSWQKGQYEHLWFKNGQLARRELGDWKDTKCPSGTSIVYSPDPQFFGNVETDKKYFENFFNDITCLCPGLTIDLNGEKIKHDSINELIDRKLGDNIEIINNRLVIEHKSEDGEFDLALSFCGNSSSTIIPYVNYGLTNTGPHITAIKSTITRVFNNWAKENGLLKKTDKNLDGNSIQEGVLLVCNIVTKNVAYNAQVKTTVTKIDSSFVTSILGEKLEIWLDNNPEDAHNIINKALVARKAAEAAKKAREAVKNKQKLTAAKKPKIMNPDKLKDAEFLGEDSTLLIVEGLSAGASMAVARDTEKYGILMLRGKLINAFTNSEDKLLKNEEIQLLFKALNIGPNQYDPSKLRYGRVGICVDSDSDGDNIALLIMCALQHFCPQFIEDGRLCWLRSPLYIVKKNGKEDYYFTDQEMNVAKAEGLVSGEVQRNKGLGALSAEQAKNSMFGENQKMDVITPDSEAIILLKELMGKSVTPRKDFIFNNIDFSEVRE